MDPIHEKGPPGGKDSLRGEAFRAVRLAAQHAKMIVHADGHWAGPLLSDPTFTTQYIFTLISLGQPIQGSDRKAHIDYFLSTQEPDGSWALAPQYPYGGNLSVTVETYLALKMLGLDPAHAVMRNAQKWILQNGGLEKVRNTTRLFLAMFGIISWSSIPQLPLELVLLPPWFPINLFQTAMWIRTTIVALLVLRSHEPVYQLPVGDSATSSPTSYLDELWGDKAPSPPTNKRAARHLPYTRPVIPLLFSNPVALIFQLVDLLLLYFLAPILSRLPTHQMAIDKCMNYMITRQEPEGMYGGFTICLCFYIQCLALEGYPVSSHEIQSGLQALHDNMWEWFDDDNGKEKTPGKRKDKGRYLQASTSPIWDTLFMSRALLDYRQTVASFKAEADDISGLVKNAIGWIRSKEIRERDIGDWQVLRPGVEPASYSFEYVNRWFPDVDDTAVAVLALLEAEKIQGERPGAGTEHIIRAAKWCVAMQNSDGGWAAFDSSDGTAWLWNSIVFSDMDCMCDPSCPDVTGRCLEMMGLLKKSLTIEDDHFNATMDIAVQKGIDYLWKTQAEFGGWWARWGINYLYGTNNALSGLYYFQELPCVKEMILKAVHWLESVQNADGGWGEQDDSFLDPSLAGKGPSTPSQTAWALMGLLKHVSPTRDSVMKGVKWLVKNQKVSTRSPILGGRLVDENREIKGVVTEHGTWEQEIYTGVGHPNQICFGYDMYRHYYPTLALARYLNALEAENGIGEKERCEK
ncbi:squalene-hopene cyclase [Naviculisporaceae sp. PSN 640]